MQCVLAPMKKPGSAGLLLSSKNCSTRCLWHFQPGEHVDRVTDCEQFVVAHLTQPMCVCGVRLSLHSQLSAICHASRMGSSQ